MDCHAGGRLKPPSGLLLLAQEHYPRLDPFWTDDSWLRLPNRREGVLMVRADDGRSWIPALNSRRLKADITTQGVPLASLLGWPEP